jgi:hypothetical protein
MRVARALGGGASRSACAVLRPPTADGWTLPLADAAIRPRSLQGAFAVLATHYVACARLDRFCD